jgi:cell division protein FtsQ
LAALSSQLRQRLVAVTAEASTRVRLELTEHRTVIWGDATQNAAKSRIATTLLSRSGGVIDVSAPSVVTVG